MIIAISISLATLGGVTRGGGEEEEREVWRKEREGDWSCLGLQECGITY